MLISEKKIVDQWTQLLTSLTLIVLSSVHMDTSLRDEKNIQRPPHIEHMEPQDNSLTARESQMFGFINPIKFISSLHLHQHNTVEIPFLRDLRQDRENVQ